MEDSTSSTLLEIEKLKHKISSYRDTLMTLKMGTSLEDYLIMKNEFETLKMQISFIEGLTQTMDEKQQTQNAIYEDQIKQFSLQLAELKENVKEMSHEIITILNKININKNEDDSEKDSSAIQEQNNTNKSNSNSEKQSNDKPSPTISEQPSYKELRNLTNLVLQPQRNQESIASFEQTGFMGDQKDQRYFNQQYFQSINTHPNYTQNSLYNNTGKTPLRLKKTDDAPESQTNDVESNTIYPSIERASGNVNTSVLTPIDASNVNEVNDTSVIEKQIQNPVKQIDKINTETDSSDVDSKRPKNSMFFNLFRK